MKYGCARWIARDRTLSGLLEIRTRFYGWARMSLRCMPADEVLFDLISPPRSRSFGSLPDSVSDSNSRAKTSLRGVPYTIVHATQFFEFLKGLADISVVDGKVHLPHVLFQPMAADDVATAVARIAVGPPVNGIVEIAGPEQFRLDELVRRRLAPLNDTREVIADPQALYSGAKISERTLVPGNNARLGETRFETWLAQSAAPAHAA
jgi:hypothetical protein